MPTTKPENNILVNSVIGLFAASIIAFQGVPPQAVPIPKWNHRATGCNKRVAPSDDLPANHNSGLVRIVQHYPKVYRGDYVEVYQECLTLLPDYSAPVKHPKRFVVA